MSFDVGDTFAIIGLIRALVDALDPNTGSSAQYSRLSDELKSLHSTLLTIEGVAQELQRDEASHASTIDAIASEIGYCQKLIEDFNTDTKKYRESWRHGGFSRKPKRAWRKISYKMFKEQDVVMLKDSLRRRVEAIIILLLVAEMYDMLLFFSPLLFNRGRVHQTEGLNEQASICQDISHGLFVIPSCLLNPLAVPHSRTSS